MTQNLNEYNVYKSNETFERQLLLDKTSIKKTHLNTMYFNGVRQCSKKNSTFKFFSFIQIIIFWTIVVHPLVRLGQ